MKINIIKYILLVLSPLLLYSCLGDLNTEPRDTNELIKEEVYSTADGYKGVLAKCYASLILTGQQGGDGGNRDEIGVDEGYSGFTRALFYLQVASTDEIALHAGSGHGTFAMLYMNWDPSNKVMSYPYYRLYMSISYCNEFLRECTEDKLHNRGLYEKMKDDYEFYRSEVRFIRAYCYSVICDLYGSAPFIDEKMEFGTTPIQKTRKEIYDFVVNELEEVATSLKEPKGNQYGRIDKVAAWFLLSRVYLNAEVWAKENQYEKAYIYMQKKL